MQPGDGQLGAGIVLQLANRADTATLAPFLSRVFARDGQPDEGIAAWTRDLLERPHPTFRTEDFLLARSTATGAIVSALCLVPQVWQSAGIPFAVGGSNRSGQTRTCAAGGWFARCCSMPTA